ncbi:MAG TPA: hypothetical protein VGA73_11680, partial [Candidatus Binatia bacterium]
MLKKYSVSQRPDDPRRRWFCDEFFDLVVGLDKDENMREFQLLYGPGRLKRVLTWTRETEYSHDRLD